MQPGRKVGLIILAIAMVSFERTFVVFLFPIFRKMRKKLLLLCYIVLLSGLTRLTAQSVNDTIPVSTDTVITKSESKKTPPLTPYHRNVIKFNPTPMLLFGEVRNITFSYERLIRNDQSIVVQAGYLLFPRLIDDTIAGFIDITGHAKQGINLAFDYRFYPFSRNRRPAPDGLYIGGYASYYGFQFKNDINILNTNADQNGAIAGRANIVNLGMVLGYQFIFWKRFSLDLLLFGPSVSMYAAKLEISGNFDPEKIENISQELVDKLLKRFPVLGTLFSNETLKFTGTRATLSPGFRYSIQIGFHF